LGLSDTSERDRYGLALLLLIATVLVFAVTGHTAWGRALLLGTQGATVLAIFHASRLGVRARRIAAVVVAGAVVAGSLGAVAGGETLLWAPAVLGVLLVLAAPAAIVVRLTHHRRIDFTTVLGALCLYVLAGLAFAYAYMLIGDLTGHRFFAQVTEARPVDYVYFSFVTLATLGYGDLTPETDLGRMLAITETVLGQLYLVGAVAAIVSNLGRVRR
jgi:hypothetical protein